MNERPHRSADAMLAVLEHIADLFSSTFVHLDTALVLADAIVNDEQQRYFANDLTGLEAFYNHVHLDDLIATNTGQLSDDEYAALMHIGRALMRVWYDRIVAIGEKRGIRFYLGGHDTVILRCHVERPDTAPWLNTNDTALLEREGIEIWSGKDGLLALLTMRSSDQSGSDT